MNCTCDFVVEFFPQVVTASLLRLKAQTGYRLESVVYRTASEHAIPEIVWRAPCGGKHCPYRR